MKKKDKLYHMKTLLFLPLVVFAVNTSIAASDSAADRPVRVAVIDTGFGPWKDHFIPLCKEGHADTTTGGAILTKEPPHDPHGHGTHISTLIHQAFSGAIVSDKNDKRSFNDKISAMKAAKGYCQIIIRYYAPGQDEVRAGQAFTEAVRYAAAIKADFVNISGGGGVDIERERVLVKHMIERGVKVIAAAGNSGNDLSKAPFYPAMDDPEVTVVGATNDFGSKEKISTSNYGAQVDVWEAGELLLSVVPDVSGDGQPIWRKLTGTSQATAIVTGKKIKEFISKRGKDAGSRSSGKH